MNNTNSGRARQEGWGVEKWLGLVAAGATVAAGIGALYMLSKQEESSQSSTSAQADRLDSDDSEEEPTSKMDNIDDAISRLAVSPTPRVSNLNSLLADIHVRYIAIKKEEFEHHYRIFMNVFYPLHDNMKQVDAYYRRYSSRVQFAGSHFDRLRIKKPDEFDMDIVIGLPVNLQEDPKNPEESDIVIEPKHAGFVQLRAGTQYQKILVRDGADSVINSQAYKWLDDRKYILRSKFIYWFKGVVDRALNRFNTHSGYPSVTIDDIPYTIQRSSTGPAYTLIICNSKGFRLDVDLVPALKFPEKRWLGRNKAYRDIPAGCSADYWMVVPKPNKFGNGSHDEDRSWRVAMHDQEKKFIYNSFHLRQANRLLKKLRDAQGMGYIASYYIKTLFLWKIDELNDPSFWRKDVATIFKIMLREFYEALVEKKIRYFWNRRNNLIERVPEHILKGYANKVGKLLIGLQDDNNYMCAAQYLLTPSEYSEYARLLQTASK